MGTLADEWEHHAVGLTTHKATPNLIVSCRHAWYTGVMFVLDTLREKGEKCSTEEIACWLLSIEREADQYAAEEFFKQRTGER